MATPADVWPSVAGCAIWAAGTALWLLSILIIFRKGV